MDGDGSQHAIRRGFVVDTSVGLIAAASVVVTTGIYQIPRVPEAADLPADILQVHTSAYQHPSALPPGVALVVGTG